VEEGSFGREYFRIVSRARNWKTFMTREQGVEKRRRGSKEVREERRKEWMEESLGGGNGLQTEREDGLKVEEKMRQSLHDSLGRLTVQTYHDEDDLPLRTEPCQHPRPELEDHR
jgi:hypothetical protein